MNELNLYFVKRLKFGVSERFQDAANEPSLVVGELPSLIVAHVSLGVVLRKTGENERTHPSYDNPWAQS